MDTGRIQYKQGIPFYPVTFPVNEADGIVIEDLRLQQLIDYINTHNIKNAYICNVNDYDFLYQCRDLEHLAIELKSLPQFHGSLEKKGSRLIKRYDTTPLYELRNLKSISIIDVEEPYIISDFKIDISKFTKLEMYSGEGKFIEKLEQTKTLKSLWLNGYEKETLEDLAELKVLDTLELNTSRVKSLKGCENLPKLQCLYLYNNRGLSNISALKEVDNLKALRIENCSKLQDFSALEEMQELELLELSGSNQIASISFVEKLRKLKTFIFSVNIVDGDLNPCLALQYVYCDRGRKHYNLKDRNLPKGKYIRGNENIERWRRFE